MGEFPKCVVQFVVSKGQKSKAGGLLFVVGIRPVADAVPGMKQPAIVSAAKKQTNWRGVARQGRARRSWRRGAGAGSVAVKDCFAAALRGGRCAEFWRFVMVMVCSSGFDLGGSRFAEFQIGHRV